MKVIHTAILPLASLCLLCGFAAAMPTGAGPDPVVPYSSSLPNAPSAAHANHDGSSYETNAGRPPRTGAFSSVAAGVTLGADGLGFQVATPLATRFNLRVNASFLNYDPSVVQRGMPIDGTIKFRSVGGGVDIYPFRNTFHITPGFTFYNGNTATGIINIASGSIFSINGTNYTDSYTDPVRGNVSMTFGRKFAPSLTVGFGNMLRRDSHWSIPTEFGFQYIGQPKFVFNLEGSVCRLPYGCAPIISDPTTAANVQQEQAEFNNDISPLRFYPIAKVGLSYRIGHNTKMSLSR